MEFNSWFAAGGTAPELVGFILLSAGVRDTAAREPDLTRQIADDLERRIALRE
jgi:hypothetical protein